MTFPIWLKVWGDFLWESFSGFLNSKCPWTWTDECGTSCCVNAALRRDQTPHEYTATPVIRWWTSFIFLQFVKLQCCVRLFVSLLWPLCCFHSLCTCCCPAVSIRPSVWGFISPALPESFLSQPPIRTSGGICLSVCHCAVCVTDSVFNLTCSQNNNTLKL